MAVAFDAAGGTTSLLQPASITWAHTVTGASTYLVVCVGLTAGVIGDVTGVTYNGVAMSNLWNRQPVGFGIRGTGWGLKNPSVGTNNVVASISGANDGITGTSASYTGVDQTTPTGTAASAENASTGTTATVDVTSASGELVVGGVVIGNVATAITIGAGQTQRASQDLIPNGEHRNIISDEAGAASVTHSWTWTGATDWTIGAVSLKPSGLIVPDYVLRGLALKRGLFTRRA